MAVAPFVNISQRTEDEWIGAGIAETVATDLQRLGWSVLGQTTVVEALGARQAVESESAAAAALHGVRRDLIEFELPVAAYFAAGAPWLGDEIAYRDNRFLDYADGRALILLGVEEEYEADRITLQAWG